MLCIRMVGKGNSTLSAYVYVGGLALWQVGGATKATEPRSSTIKTRASLSLALLLTRSPTEESSRLASRELWPMMLTSGVVSGVGR